MIFGDPPQFDAVVETIATVEAKFNAAGDGQGGPAA